MSDRNRSRSPVSKRERNRSRSLSPLRPQNMRSKRCIISNIPYDLKWQEIKDLFRQEVGDVMYVDLFNNPDGKPKGSGVIEFKDLETAALAIEKMHRYEIRDRKLVVREERDRDRRQIEMSSRGGGQGLMGPPSSSMGGMGSGSGGGFNGGGGGGGFGGGGHSLGISSGINPQILKQLGIEGPLSNSVFVSNLDFKVTWKKLKDVFRLAGNVLHTEIMEEKDGRSRGMGIVTFETPLEAVQAISMFNNQSLFDRTMRVKMDGQPSISSRQEPLPTGLKHVGPSLQQISSMDLGNGVGSGMALGLGNMDRLSTMSGMGNMGSLGGMGSNISGMGRGMYGIGSLGGMGGSISGMGIGDTFNGIGSSGLSDNFGMSSLGTGLGGSSGFNSIMESSRSLGLNNYGSSSRNDYGRDSNRSSSGNMPSSGDMKTRADNSTVIVKNLPYSVDWQTLKSSFQTVGEIRFAEISKNDKGRSNGWGLVSFKREDDALLAVKKMNRANIEGRAIVVKLLN